MTGSGTLDGVPAKPARGGWKLGGGSRKLAAGGWQLAFGLTVAASTWAILLVAVPRQLAAGGSARLAAAVYLAGSVVCHQRPERSFRPGGIRMPVCARCAGLYLSAAVGLLAGWLGRAREPRRARVILAASLVPMALSVSLEWAGVAAQSNLVRAATGLPAGAVAGWLVLRMLRSARQRCGIIMLGRRGSDAR